MTSPAQPQHIAEAVAHGMMARDQASSALGMRVTAISPGCATLEMRVRADMLNGFDICHGGYITLLADSAFAFACNSYNALTVASGLGIDFIAPARAGDTLRARAHEVSLSGRTGVYDVDIHNQREERIAVFRGRSYRMTGKQVLDLDAPPPASAA